MPRQKGTLERCDLHHRKNCDSCFPKNGTTAFEEDPPRVAAPSIAPNPRPFLWAMSLKIGKDKQTWWFTTEADDFGVASQEAVRLLHASFAAEISYAQIDGVKKIARLRN